MAVFYPKDGQSVSPAQKRYSPSLSKNSGKPSWFKSAPLRSTRRSKSAPTPVETFDLAREKRFLNTHTISSPVRLHRKPNEIAHLEGTVLVFVLLRHHTATVGALARGFHWAMRSGKGTAG